MLFVFMEMYCEELFKAYNQLVKSTEAAIKGEPNYQKQLKDREGALSEIDGIPMTDEEIEANVAIQAQSSPYRRKVSDDVQRVLKVMKDG
jgi:chaperonin cofactor prefoldin